MEQDAAPAGGRRTRLPKHPGRARCPAGGHYEPPAGRRLTGAAVTACPQTASRKAQPGAASSVYDCGRSGMKTTANEPGHWKMSGWRAGRRFRIFARRCGSYRLAAAPLARRPLASGGAKRPREDGPARGLDKEYGRWRAPPEKLAV